MAEGTSVHLLNVPLDKEYRHTFQFITQQAQHDYFYSKRKKSYGNFSYQRKDGTITVPENVETLIESGCNYVMYKNPENQSKWIYAFIDGMEYKNPNATIIRIKTDCVQTWLFEYTVKPSFVEREHAKSDIFGEHTLDEGLETGAFTVNQRYSLNYGSKLCIIVAVSKTPEGEKVAGHKYNGIYSGLQYYVFNADTTTQIREFIESYDADGVGEDIVSMFLAPQALAGKDGIISWSQPLPESADPHLTSINHAGGPAGDAQVIQEFSKDYIDNQYKPRNNKLLCYPYRYLLVTNNAGGTAVYKFEKFYDKGVIGSDGKHKITQYEPCFSVEGVICPGCSIRLYPRYYNGAVMNLEEGLTMGKFPILNWTSDAYTNWLTQNSVNIALNVASGIGQIVAGAALAIGTGGVATAIGGGSIVGGISAIAGTLSQVHQQSFAPEQVKGNVNAGDVITAMGSNSFDFYVMSITNEYAKIIDGYFDMYGYKCNCVKVPEKYHRKSYWYTKTIDANIIGAIPQEDLQVIKDCYNRGITFWYDQSNFLNYAVDNSTVEG